MTTMKRELVRLIKNIRKEYLEKEMKQIMLPYISFLKKI